MKDYELIREIFNNCSNNSMRDRFITEIRTDSIENVVESFCIGTNITCSRHDNPDGSVIFDLEVDGLPQRLTFCEI